LSDDTEKAIALVKQIDLKANSILFVDANKVYIAQLQRIALEIDFTVPIIPVWGSVEDAVKLVTDENHA